MRFHTQPHHVYCGIDLHARTMSLCIVHRDGASLVHRTMPAGPDPLRTAIAPSREDVGVCVAWLCTWDGLAALCARRPAFGPWRRGRDGVEEVSSSGRLHPSL
jgi:hypothetical protein